VHVLQNRTSSLLDAQTIVLNTRTPVMEWWSVQGFGYGTRLIGHTGSGPPYGTGIRSLEPAPRPSPVFVK
jgi:hypothetical protein